MKKLLPTTVLLAMLVGCMQRPDQLRTHRVLSQERIKDSNTVVDITYTLGHIQHRLILEASQDMATGKTFSGHHMLEEGKISKDGYLAFIQRALDFVEAPRRAIAHQNYCRNPFSITVKISESKAKTFDGCRSTDSGDFSRLVREGEFLLYSQK